MKKREKGYVVDTAYPIFFYKEMSPLWLNSVINFLGFETRALGKKFSYLELGCATGINLIVSAINNPDASFIGVDFNKTHIDIAKNMAKELELNNIKFINCNFDSFLKTNDMKFDYIVCHGTYSWISKENQESILEIVYKLLNDLGIFYLHYMCFPASTSLIPIQKLFNIVDNSIKEDSIKSVQISKQLFYDLEKSGAFIDNEKIESIVKTLDNSNEYLAHEFLTNDWTPLFSSDVHKMVYDISKTTYIGSANPYENIDNISVPSRIQALIKEIKIPALKEYVKDLARNSKQRVDMFQKNPKILKSDEHIKTINKMRFKLLPNSPKTGEIIFKTQIGEIKASKEIISPLLEKLSKQIMSFEELLKLESFKNNPIFLIETIFLLMNEGYLQIVSNNYKEVNTRLVEKFNKKMMNENINLEILSECNTAI